jgi:hypothetical protein
MSKKKISSHKAYQITITAGMVVIVTAQHIGWVGPIISLVSIGINMLWLWEDDLNRIVFKNNHGEG